VLLFHTCEEVGKFDWQYDSFLQRFLGPLEAGNVVPLDVGLLHDDGPWKRGAASETQLVVLPKCCPNDERVATCELS